MKTRSRYQRIGIFGGTFDPPHLGHLIIAEQACEQLRLDKLLFVPAYLAPHKKKGGRANPLQRLHMVKMSISVNRKFEAAPVEIRRKGVSYTVDTLRELRSEYGRAAFYLIVGGDNYATIRSWKSVNEILRMATIVVYRREHPGIRSRTKRVQRHTRLRGAMLDISSTMIRNRVKQGESIRFLVTENVRRFIEKNKLYL
ncbi:MAG TPA: nicotinate-nucleotide adenylyltransferase [Bacteroidota bacterium]